MTGPGPKVVLVGPSKRFLGGISYYTYGLAGALAKRCDLAVLLIRRLMPVHLYPGGRRVGQALSEITLPAGVPVFDGLDYFWGPSALGARKFLRRQKPDILVLQWWSATVLHSYLLLSWLARRHGAQVIIEFHETQDPAEQTYRLLAAYVRVAAPWLFANCAAFVVHSESDRALMASSFHIDPVKVAVIPHAIYEHQVKEAARRAAPDGVCHLLFFGLIRPVKGLDDLIAAMDLLDDEEIKDYWLTIVGETWEHCERIVAMARSSRHADRITIVNRYVSDEEADAFFAGADVVVLPYRRSSQSGVLHMAMGYGMPVVATNVGGLAEAATAYDRAEIVEPSSPGALLDGIRRARRLTPSATVSGPSWGDSANAYRALIDRLLAGPAPRNEDQAPQGLGRAA
jgi:glycosyltransferase involved in cell wall biosynthesis